MTRYFIEDANGKTLHVPTLSHGPYGGETNRAFAEKVASTIKGARVSAVLLA